MPSQKSRSRLHRKNGPQCRCGLIAQKSPLRVSTQLLVFRYYDTTGALDELLLRVRCQNADHFVGALWICRKFSGIVTGAKIRLCAMVLDVGQKDANSRSIRSRYVLKSGVQVLIFEFVVGTHCILTQWQVKPKLPDSPHLLHRDNTFSIGMPIYAKLTISRLPLGRHVLTMRSDSIFLAIGLIVWLNYLMLSFLEVHFYCAGRTKIPTWR